MTARRGGGARYDQGGGSPAYHEIKKSIADVADRTEAVFDRLEQRLDRMDKDVQRTQLGQDRLASELTEIRRDVGELRDATHQAANKAVAAAVTAAPVAAAAAANTTVHALPKTWWGKLIIVATAFTTLMVAINNVPDAVRIWDKTWVLLRNDPPAHVRPAEAKK